MTTLRSRIFKRVKPKILNGRYITGEEFLELCQAYTTAINQGSVPCIESAWTYLCQNECHRAVQDAIATYEKDLKASVFIKQNDCRNYDVLKQCNKQLKEQSILFFREKAVGQNLKEFETQISDEIHKRYMAVKAKCLQIYEMKCHEAVAKEVEKLESEIR